MVDKFLALYLKDPQPFSSPKRILSCCIVLMKLVSNICSCFNYVRVSLNFQKHCESNVILKIQKNNTHMLGLSAMKINFDDIHSLKTPTNALCI